jgi:1,4-alpha-glucan branching enzyme
MNTLPCEMAPAVALGRYSAKRTRHHVNFFCQAPGAVQVSIVGDFNNWQPKASPMRRMPDGSWMTSLEPV